MNQPFFPIQKPLIVVGTISTHYGVKAAYSNHLPIDLIEYRLDSILLELDFAEGIIALQRSLQERSLPVLLTIRSKKEGGMFELSDCERSELFEKFFPYVDCVDLEWQEYSKLSTIYSLYKNGGKKIILSIHSLSEFIDLNKLIASLPDIKLLNPDFVKVAVRIENLRQLKQLTELFFSFPKIPWSLMGIGEFSHLSRIVLSALGSRLVYGYIDKPAALGQPSVLDLKENFQRLGIIAKNQSLPQAL
jgi:3-dehydroquinate dehydratase-1